MRGTQNLCDVAWADTRAARRYCAGIYSSVLVRAVPFAFVLIWATGFVAARYAAPHAEPLWFLSARYAGVIVLMLALAVVARAPWPGRRQALHLAVAGIGIQAGYLGGVWVAVAHGMPAGVAALIVNLQPVLTAVFAGFVGERIRPRQGLGLVLGFVGVVLVVATKLDTSGLTVATIALAVGALLAITAGTLYQKRFCPDFDLRTGQVVQFVASLLITLPLAMAFEPPRIEWNGEVALALAWSVFVLTGGGISLLFIMLRRGAASEVTSYFYLVPGITALIAWAMFGETLGLLAIAGMALAVLGVALTTRRTGGLAAAATSTPPAPAPPR